MAVYTEIHIRRDSTLNWYASNPRLALGEPGVDMDLHRFKIGNGIDRWNQLPYMDDDLYKLLDKQAQEIADRVQDLLNKIKANKLDADTKHTVITTELRNTSRELNERMTAVEDEQAEYEESLTSRQDEYEESLTGEFEETKADVHAGLDEFAETRDKLNVRMDAIVGQATEDTEILDARVDAEYQTHPNLGANIRNIHEQLISAEQIQEEEIARLKSADESHDVRLSGLEDKAEKLSRHGEFLQGEIDTNAEAILRTQTYLFGEALKTREKEVLIREEVDSKLRSNDESIRRDLKHEEGSRIIRDEDLSERIEELSGAVLQGQFYSLELTEQLKKEEQARCEDTASARDSALLRDEHQQEQIDELATALMSEAKARREGDELQDRKLSHVMGVEREERYDEEDRLRQEIQDSARLSYERDEHQQLQTNELAWAFICETLARHTDEQKIHEQANLEQSERIKADSQLEDNIQSIAGHSLERDQHQQEQTDALAGVIISEAIRNHEERQARIQGDKTLHTEITRADRQHSERVEHLQEQADELAGSVLGLIHQELKDRKENAAQQERETSQRIAGDEHLQEQADMTAQAVIRGQLQTLSTEKRLRSEEYSRDEAVRRIREVLIESTSHHQEQLDELTGLILRKVLDEIEERRKREIDTSHEIQSRQADTEHQQRQTNELAGAVLCGMLNSYRAMGKIMTRLKVIERALIEDGIVEEDDIPRYTDDDIDGMLEGIFSGSSSGSELDITDETDQEFYNDIAQIFNP